MATYIGFNTIGQTKKFTLTDYSLIKRDLANAFNIRQGEVPGRPDVGTLIWNMVFENQVEDLQRNIEKEIRRVVALDPRIQITQLNVYPQQNGILVEVEVDTVATTDPQVLSLFFDIQQQIAILV